MQKESVSLLPYYHLPVYQSVVFLASPAEIGHRLGCDDEWSQLLPQQVEAAVSNDTVVCGGERHLVGFVHPDFCVG